MNIWKHWNAAGERPARTDGNTDTGGGRAVGAARRALTGVAALLLACGLSLVPGVALQANAQRVLHITGASKTVQVTVAVGKTQDVRVDSAFVDLTVGDAEVADITPLTDRSLSILGKKIGTTRVSVYSEGKQLVGIFDVEVSYDVSRLAVEIAKFAGAGIKVSSVNGRILLSGYAADAATLDRAVVVARQFAPDVINTVEVTRPQQVMLEVRFIEVTREAGRDLGVQWRTSGSKGIVNLGLRRPSAELPVVGAGPNIRPDDLTISAAATAAGVLSGGNPFGFLLGTLMTNGTPIDVAVNALETRGLARSLAEPNLVALSGDTASFLAGGEYPIPVPGTLGQISVEFKRYGVGLAFTPTVLKDKLINLKIEPEVSELDIANSVAVGNGISVPALTVRRASTTIEMRDGQSFVIGGLLKSTGQNQIEQLPWIGSVPVLGTLFRSTSYQKNETDLVIIVTPRIVRPLRPGDPIATPFDRTLPPNDTDLFLLGKTEVERKPARLALETGRPFVGHMIDLPKGGVYAIVSK